MAMIKNLQKQGIQEIQISENEYNKLLKEDPEFKNLTEQCNVTSPLIPHQAFKGGCTNVF